ncbi:hypothetical protein LTR86_008030 [Recurvomyces mirabilis]|nr:hypothetical protein LTR86_008030 [Recurvomyces mirabilis]
MYDTDGSRCQKNGLQCTFILSQRGRTGRGRKSVLRPQAPYLSVDNFERNEPEKAHETIDDIVSTSHLQSVLQPARQTHNYVPDPTTSGYYENFHGAHPFILPQKITAADPLLLPPYLRACMSYVAMHFSGTGSAPTRITPSTQDLQGQPKDLFKIQACLLLALASFARLECQKGQTSLMEAIALANAFRLDTESFVLAQPAILQDSCRRTWWELFVVTNLVRSILDIPVHLSLAGCDLRLPGDDALYDEGATSTETRTLKDMQARFLNDDDDEPWAASAYKVEATRILSTIMSAEDKARDPAARFANTDAFQASISSWWLSLPPNKRHATRGDGRVDESMFMALMIINMSSLRINLPRSDLAASWRSATLCSDFGTRSSTRDAAYHTACALKAANSLSSLIASEGSAKLHTPCSACAIAFGTIIQLPSYLRQRNDDLKENIQLGLIYLKRMGEVWPLASQVRLQLASVARAVLAAPDDHNQQVSQAVVTDVRTDLPTSAQGDRWLEFARQMLTSPGDKQMTFQEDLAPLPDGDAWLQDMLDAESAWPSIDLMT